jgi:hypothetical protein
MFQNWLVSLLALVFLVCAAPACKKTAPEEGADAVESAENKKSKKKKRKKKGKSKKSKKGKSKKTTAKDKPAEEKGQKPAKAVKSAAHDATNDKSERLERKVLDGDPAGRPPARPERAERTPAGQRERPVPRNIKPPPVQVPVTKYLSVADLSQRLPDKGWVSYGPIQGIARAEHYNSVIYRRPSTPAFVSLQVWDFGAYAQALEKWNELLATSPNSNAVKDMFTKLAFFSYRNQVISLTFVEPDHAMVLSLSCHSQTCDDNSLYELAKTAYVRAH